MIPPLAPPNGTFTTAHFQVIQAATARKIVLHAKTFKDLNAAGIHSRGDVNLQLAVRHAHHGVQIGIE